MPEAALDRTPRSDLVRDVARIQRSLEELTRVLQFRDRDRACCHGLSVSQCRALELLARLGPMSVTEMGNRLLLEKSTASRLARGLMEKELIRRRAPRSDGRVVILQVTEAGQRLARRIGNDLAQEYRSLVERFEPRVRKALPDLLEALVETVAQRVDSNRGHCAEG